jgi:DNA-binding MarR family transcriptional regulator
MMGTVMAQQQTRSKNAPTATDIVTAFREANLTFDLVGQTMKDAVALGRTDLRVLELLSTRGDLTPGQLLAELRLQSGSVSGLVDRLVEAGCVRREPDPRDGRRTRVVITPRGRRRWSTAWARISTSIDDAVRNLSPDQMQVVHEFLLAARDACEAALAAIDAGA